MREMAGPSRRRTPHHIEQGAHADPTNTLISFTTKPQHPAEQQEVYFGVFSGMVCTDLLLLLLQFYFSCFSIPLKLN